MEKIRLDILSLVPSPVREDVFTLLLGEVEGSRRLPMLLGPVEAQAIALALEEAQLERPLTHELFKEVLLQLTYSVQEVMITALSNQVFLAQMTLSNGAAPLTVDARPSDAIAMALRFGATIYIEAALLEEASLHIAPSAPATNSTYSPIAAKPLEEYSLATLQQILQQVVAQEDYEQAALLRDEINRRSSTLGA